MYNITKKLACSMLGIWKWSNMILSFYYESKKIEFNVVYSKRKTLSIKIEPPGYITVAAPYRASEEAIIDVVRKRGDWIQRKLLELQERENLKKVHNFIDGEDFLYLGLNYSLRLIINNSIKKPKIWLEEDLLYIELKEDNPSYIKPLLEKWYREKALEKISERIDYYSKYFNRKPSKIVVKEQKKRWGSCNSRGELFFNWRIVMAPLRILDYIVVHEMSHMVHLNHSKDYWEFVSTILPDYKDHKSWLKEYGITLTL